MSRYLKGQRWTYQPAGAEFEETLVIGAVTPVRPEWGWNEEKYEVYVRYTDAAKTLLPTGYDGTILSLNEAGLDRSVIELVKSGVKLPWWWVYGQKLRSKKDAPNGCSVLSCERVSDVLPHVFRSARQRAEYLQGCKEALRQHRAKYGSAQPKRRPSKSVAESWKRIAAWHAENASPIDQQLGRGASTAAIAKFEKQIGASLPEEFKESVKIHDGGGWWVPHNRGEFLSLEGILKQWKMYSEWQEQGTYAVGDDWVPREIKGPIKPVFWNPRRIHVTDNSGDHLTLDLDPPDDGSYGQVLHHSHEVGPTDVAASSWGAFLRSLVDDLESGKYVYLKHEGSLESVEELERIVKEA